ncbi:MAG: AI-2E family transporter, partial [Gammaproteobacteria bacterium]|nr:AI-2E family transporter [Gammaproteobacteria bacterium]
MNAVPQPDPAARADDLPPESSAAAVRLPSARPAPGRAAARPLWILAFCVAVAACRLGRELLVPMVLALLAALVLSGIVEALRRYHIPRGFSALGLLLLIGAAVGGVLHAVWTPARQWVESAPHVLRVIERKTRPAQSVVRRIDAIARRASA